MPVVTDANSEVSVALSDLLSNLATLDDLMLTQVNTQLNSFVRTVGSIVSYNLVDLIDKIFGLYSYEWVYANNTITTITNLITQAFVNEVAGIQQVLYNVEAAKNVVIQSTFEQIAAIDAEVNAKYNRRMSEIYGQLAAFSTALDVPANYLETHIENAKYFAMAISCLAGVSYYEFLSGWDDGLYNLLSRIANSISLYKIYPQQIKTDIEIYLTIPLYNLYLAKSRQKQQQITDLQSGVNNLSDLVTEFNVTLTDLKTYAENLYPATIEPQLIAMRQENDVWRANVFAPEVSSLAKLYATLTIGLSGVFEKAEDILGMLNYGGDLLLRIDGLPFSRRIEQEDKIAVAANRSLVRVIPDWQQTVEDNRE